MLRSLLTLALFAYPKDFRAAYRQHVSHDLEDRSTERGYSARLLFDIIASGLAMRADLLWRDISYAIRTLRKSPLFTGVVVGTLAVAIAANAVIFSALDAVLLQPLPFPHADRLFIVYATQKPVAGMPTIANPGVRAGGTRIRATVQAVGVADGARQGVPVQIFMAAAGHSTVIASSGMSASSNQQVRLDGRVTVLNHGIVSPQYFQTLGVTPYIGRFFQGNAPGQTVISYALWQSKYGGAPSVIGKLLRINADVFKIVGVAPPQMFDPSFGAMTKQDLWTLMPPMGPNVSFFANPIIRLRPGVSLTAFNAELQRMWTVYAQRLQAPLQRQFFSSVSLAAQPLRDAVVADTQSLWIVFGAAALLLLIACANIANLMLARAASRRNEYGMRAALGATTRRIAAQSTTETLIVSILGCAIGLAIGAACLHPTIALLPGNLPRLTTAHIDLNVLLYVCALGIGVTLLAGVIPALKTSSSSAPAKRNPRTVRALVALEVAAAFTLLVCSGLLLRSFLAVTSQHLGFDPHQGYVASFSPQVSGDSGPPAMPDLSAVAPRVTARIRALPGVTEAALTTQPPFTTPYMMMAESQFWLEGQPKPTSDDETHMSSRVEISPDYLKVAGMTLATGREFTPSDLHGQRVVLVNQTFADRILKTKTPVGKRLEDGMGPGYQIIGIVADTRNSLTQDPAPMVYFPLGAPGLGPNGSTAPLPFFNIFFRTIHDDPHIATEVSNVAHQVYPQFDVVPVTSLDQAVRDSAANARAAFLLLAGFTLIAIVLALAGIYGVVAFSVERRYHEIGVRMALGASNTGTLRDVIAGALAQSAVGIAIGLVVAAFASQTLQAQLFKIAPLDPASFIGAVALLLACTALAAAIPAWRAMRIDPARTLRYE